MIIHIYNKIRDTTYLLKPIVGLVLGYNLAKKYANNALIYIVNCGVILSVIHLIIIGYSILAHKTLSVSEIRHYAGYFNDFEPYVLILILFSSKFNIILSKTKEIYLFSHCFYFNFMLFIKNKFYTINNLDFSC